MALSESDKKSIFNLLNREATAVELAIFDTMWSEHCSYKSLNDGTAEKPKI